MRRRVASSHFSSNLLRCVGSATRCARLMRIWTLQRRSKSTSDWNSSDVYEASNPRNSRNSFRWISWNSRERANRRCTAKPSRSCTRTTNGRIRWSSIPRRASSRKRMAATDKSASTSTSWITPIASSKISSSRRTFPSKNKKPPRTNQRITTQATTQSEVPAAYRKCRPSRNRSSPERRKHEQAFQRKREIALSQGTALSHRHSSSNQRTRTPIITNHKRHPLKLIAYRITLRKITNNPIDWIKQIELDCNPYIKLCQSQ